ncbi:MAG: PilZ domain-containing protein [Endomicrobiales bacterium]|nr:PilZ domain-containing protein [Endomicrobiales bacterium]
MLIYQEKRRLQRKPFVSTVRIFSGEERTMVGKGYIANWSEGGLCVIASHDIEIGKRILLNFNTPNGWEFDLMTRVVYSRKNADATSYGVKFMPGQAPFLFKLAQQLSHY